MLGPGWLLFGGGGVLREGTNMEVEGATMIMEALKNNNTVRAVLMGADGMT